MREKASITPMVARHGLQGSLRALDADRLCGYAFNVLLDYDSRRKVVMVSAPEDERILSAAFA